MDQENYHQPEFHDVQNEKVINRTEFDLK